ncbi:MAG: hypothetical protein U1F87_07325 [Kiritimatiellia bacterium]
MRCRTSGYHLLGALTGRDPPDTWPGFRPRRRANPRPDLAPAPAGRPPRGCSADPGYGDLEFAKIDGRLHAHFQGRLATAGLDAAGQPAWSCPPIARASPSPGTAPPCSSPLSRMIPSVRFVAADPAGPGSAG